MQTVSLAPDGAIRVTLPTGRTVDFEVSERGAWALQRFLYRCTEVDVEKAMGLRSAYPTEHLVQSWLREHKVTTEPTTVEKRYGLDLSTLKISL